MCGIAGIVRISRGHSAVPPSAAIPEAWLDILDAGIKHRGPDGHGRFRDRVINAQGDTVDVALVHRRLSIIDHADGAQPMVSSCGSALVFNGCIYNHRALRQDLRQLGRTFSTHHSDTEAILQGWLQWGSDLFSRLDGMYAAAWWDRARSRLQIARDPCGEKPLYWANLAENDGVVIRACASTVPALNHLYRAVNNERCPLSSLALAQWIECGFGEKLPYQHIYELFPGTLLDLSGPDCVPKDTASNLHAIIAGSKGFLSADRVDELLRNSVHSRLEADVPMGFFLSGGIDSALVCAYAAERRPDLTAFTVQMPESAFDESVAASHTAAFLGISHRVLPCPGNPSEDIVTIIKQLGLPFGDSSLLPSMWVSRAARTVATVALGGDGGDELFMGYDRHRITRLLWQLSHLPRPILRLLAACSTLGPDPKSWRTRAARLLSAAANGGYKDLLAIFPPGVLHALNIEIARTSSTSVNACSSAAQACSIARSIDTLHYLPSDLLRKSDTASMHSALELRSPFLGRELCQAALSATNTSLMPGGERKGLLKAVARRYLPGSVVDRPKQGFAIPIGNWFRSDFGGMQTLLLDTFNSADPFPAATLGISIDRKAVQRLVDEHMGCTRDHSQRLYMLMVLAIWAKC